MTTPRLILAAGLLVGLGAAAAAADLSPLLQKLQAVGPQGKGHQEATAAWQAIVQSDAAQLPAVLASLDDAKPLAANWIRTAADTIAERQLQQGRRLPTAELEQFVLDRRHAPRARRLAYEWLVRADPTARQRLIPGMLNDPSTELRRDAVARLADEAVLAQASQKDRAMELYRQALNAARDMDQVKTLADRLAKLGQPVDLAKQLGYVVRWKLIGPFDNTERKGFATAYPPESELRFGASYPGKHGAVRWVDYRSTDALGKVDFHQAFTEEKQVVGYAATDFQAEARREVEFRLSSFNATKLWLNGALVAEYPVYHSGGQPDQYVSRVAIRPGRNTILLKVCQNEQTQEWTRQWGFQFRVCDADGGAVLSTDTEKPKSPPEKPGSAK